MFWLIACIVAQTVNALGKTQLGLEDSQTSLLTTSINLGIAIGCTLGGYLSRDRIDHRVVTTGTVGLIATLLLMSLPGGSISICSAICGSIPRVDPDGHVHRHVHRAGAGDHAIATAAAEKGRMIATMNQCSGSASSSAR